MKVLRYGRKSKDKKNYSFKDQSIEIREYCKKNNLEIVGGNKDIKKGNGIKRPGLKKVLDRRRKENLDGIVVACVDRLTRSVDNLKELLDLAQKENFIWFFAREDISTLDEGSYTKLIHFAEFAEFEHKLSSIRIRYGLQGKNERCEKTGGYLQYGYNLENGKLVINHFERDIQKIIVYLRDEKAKTYNQIVDILNSRNIPTKLGKKWVASTVRRNYLKMKEEL